MALEHCRIIEDNVHPVHVDGREIIVVLTCSHTDLLLILDTFCCIHEVPVAVGYRRPSHLHAVVHIRAVHIATALGCDHDDTVCSTGTIDGSRRCVLEDRHALDIRRVDGIEVRSGDLHTVENIQRSCSRVDGVGTTDSHGCRSTWLTCIGKHGKSGHLSLECLVKGSSRSALKFVRLYSRNGTGNGSLLSYTIGDDNHIIKLKVFRLHHDIVGKFRYRWNNDLLVHVSDA